jgi:hypothetical protein
MKNLILILIVFLNSIVQINAQNYFEEIGRLSPDQLKITSCSFDLTADALVLFDVGKSRFVRTDNGFDVLFERVTRIKILNEAGKKYAEIAIPFYQEGDIQEKVEVLKAFTYTVVDGSINKIVELDPKKCYEEKTSENWKALKFAMPNVQPGSIIEYKYTILSQYHFNLQDWYFQWDIPVLYSGYEVRMIPFYEYSWLLQGRQSIDELTKYEDNSGLDQEFYGTKFHDIVYKFGLKNVPAFIDEEYTPSREDDIIKIDFQLSAFYHTDGVKIKIMTTWPELVNDYLKAEDFGRYIKKSKNSSEKVLDPDSLAGKTQTQIFNYIVNYVKNNFKWNQENSQFAYKSPSDLLKDKTGSSAAINLWVIGALQQAGIESYPVAISTRKHGKIHSEYPFSNAFNSVIGYAVVDGKPMLVDATDPYCPNTRISIRCMNDKGLLIDKDNMKWINLQSPSVSSLFTYLKIDSIGKEQQAAVSVRASDYEAISYKNAYGNNKEALTWDLDKKMYQVIDSSLNFKYSLDRILPYAFSYRLSKKSEIINSKIYVEPFLSEVFPKNPLTQKSRTYPVDMTYPVNRIYQSEIVIPEGYKVEFLPGNSSQSDGLFDLDYTATQKDDKIIISLKYTFKNSVYAPEDYSKVKTQFDRIVKKGSEKVVLVKI